MNQPHISLRTATDVLEVLPALLGFWPTESLCGLFVSGRRVEMTSRADLPTTPEDLAEAASMLAEQTNRFGQVALVAYSTDQEAARRVLAQMVSILEPSRVITALVAAPQGWSAVDPEHPTAVPWANPYPKGTGQAAAAASAAGLVIYGTREDLVESVQAPDADTAEVFSAVYADETARIAHSDVATVAQETRDWIARYVAQPFTITAEEAAWVAARVRIIGVRDAAWAVISRDTGSIHAALWQDVASMTPDAAALPVLGLLGMAGWIAGNGALANVAAERAQSIPGRSEYTMLDLLESALRTAVPPSMWDGLREELIRRNDLP